VSRAGADSFLGIGRGLEQPILTWKEEKKKKDDKDEHGRTTKINMEDNGRSV
jgi:hypothetical protein